MRRPLSLVCLLLAWLCANGVTWNVVQVVAWAKMYHDYAQVMSPAEALQRTLDGSDPCTACRIVRTAEDSAREQLPPDVLGAGADKFVLACQLPATVILVSPDSFWPGVPDDTGLTRTEAVPVRPPRV